IDIEMSFVTREDVITVSEVLVGRLWADLAGYQIPRPIPRMTYAEGMRRFGSDKPDLRFGCELADLTGYFGQTSFRVFQARHAWRSATGWGSLTPPPGRSCGSWTRPCSKRTVRAAGPRCTTPSPHRCPNGRTSSLSSRTRRSPTPTTWSSTAWRSVGAACVS